MASTPMLCVQCVTTSSKTTQIGALARTWQRAVTSKRRASSKSAATTTAGPFVDLTAPHLVGSTTSSKATTLPFPELRYALGIGSGPPPDNTAPFHETFTCSAIHSSGDCLKRSAHAPCTHSFRLPAPAPWLDEH